MKVIFWTELFYCNSFSNINIHTLYYLRKLNDGNEYLIKIKDNQDNLAKRISEYLPYKADAIEVLLPGIITDINDHRLATPDIFFTFLGDCLGIPLDYWQKIQKTTKKMCFCVSGFNNMASTWATELNHWDYLVTPSTRTKRLIEEIGCKTPVLVLPHGYEPDVFKPIERKKNNKFRFAMTNALAYSKGTDLVIEAFMEAFKEIKNAELYLQTIANLATAGSGHGAFYDIYIDILNRYNWQNDIYYVGKNAFPYEMAQVYQEADCVLQPHRIDCYGLLPLEATACGAPVIASRYGGPAEYYPENYPLFVEGKYDWTSLHSGKWNYPVGEFGIHRENIEILTLFQPNKEDLKNKMLLAYNKWNEGKEEELKPNLKNFPEIITWEKVVTKLTNIFKEVLE